MDSLIGKSLGQYQLLEEIGRGGMARVYRAFQSSLNRSVAIKVLPPMLATDHTFLTRFRREANVVGTLAHPNILPVYDYGEQDGLLYIVMMFVGGGTLRDRMMSPIDVVTIGKIIGQLADALDYAHRQGIVHRDIKPTNVLMARPDWPLLGDFGIAFASANQSLTMTGAGTGLGTPEYMSPEQGRGEKVDARSDLYSLGVMLYEMVTGRVPFQAETAVGIIHQHVFQPPVPPRQLRPDIPPSIEMIVLKSMEKLPDARFQTGAEMKVALEEAVAAIRLGATTPRPLETVYAPTPQPQHNVPTYESSVPPTPSVSVLPKKSGFPWLWGCVTGIGGVFLLGVVCVLLAFALNLGGDNSALAGLLGPTRTPTPIPIPTQTPRPTATPTPTPVPVGGEVFSDNFSDPNLGDWSLGTGNQVYFEGGKLNLVSLQENSAYRTWPRKAPAVDNAIFETTITKIDGPDTYGYGLVFRDDGKNNYYFFSITGNGSFRLERHNSSAADGNEWETVIDWTRTNAIERFNNGTNVLKVIAVGKSIKLFVNDRPVGSVEDEFNASGTYGILVGTTGLHVQVSNITVTKQ